MPAARVYAQVTGLPEFPADDDFGWPPGLQQRTVEDQREFAAAIGARDAARGPDPPSRPARSLARGAICQGCRVRAVRKPLTGRRRRVASLKVGLDFRPLRDLRGAERALLPRARATRRALSPTSTGHGASRGTSRALTFRRSWLASCDTGGTTVPLSPLPPSPPRRWRRYRIGSPSRSTRKLSITLLVVVSMMITESAGQEGSGTTV